ncbi:MAG TPA: hypothetical protein DCM87_03370 [Planctomycetes bacterium]|nr:hypothetical protein [Planctomycetota bacterium]
MPNIAAVLKDEICRLARKVARPAVGKLHKDGAALKRWVADLKRRVAGIEAEHKRLRSRIETLEGAVPKAPPDAVAKARFTAKIIKALRRKLGVSQGDLGKLAGVSTNSVYKWEQKRGRLKIRQGTAAALLALRGMGKREVRARLGKTRK